MNNETCCECQCVQEQQHHPMSDQEAILAISGVAALVLFIILFEGRTLRLIKRLRS